MAEAIGSALCVGGPRDGHLIPLLDSHGERLCVLNAPACESDWWTVSPDLVSTSTTLNIYTYHRRDFHAPPGPPLTVWAAPHLTLHDVQVRLVTAYYLLAQQSASRGSASKGGGCDAC